MLTFGTRHKNQVSEGDVFGQVNKTAYLSFKLGGITTKFPDRNGNTRTCQGFERGEEETLSTGRIALRTEDE